MAASRSFSQLRSSRVVVSSGANELRGLVADLGYEVSEEQVARIGDYHLARTSRCLTLSFVVTAWILARYAPHKARRFLEQALRSDVADVQGGTAEGIHLGAMTGTVDLLLRRLTGMRAHGQILRFDPAISPQIKRLRFSVHYRDYRVELVFFRGPPRSQFTPWPGSTRHCFDTKHTVELRPGAAQHTFSLAQGREAHERVDAD